MKYLNAIAVFILLFSAISCQRAANTDTDKPNVIIIFTDDQGYQDLGCYGSPLIKTPNIDKLAESGIRLTNYYVSNSVCSASRASLLTGKFPCRHGIGGAIFPEEGGLASKEVLLPELLKQANYNTACFGKWHLGDTPGLLPLDQGFDEYFGIPYSNDMYIAPNQKFASDAVFLDGYDLKKAQNDQDTVRVTKGFNNFKRKGLSGKVPLFENAEVVEYPCNQKTLTKRYFKRAIDFIEKSKDQPFFVYITPAMPHVPLFPSEEFKGKSKRGLYGDVVEEIDYNLGQLMNSLKENGLDKNTIVMFASDNGPWLKFGDLGGSALPLRDGKGTIFEGGIRVPCIVSWPAKWQSGKESHEVVSSYDILPTIAGYAGIDTKNMILDGTNLAQHFENTNISTGNDTYLIFRGTKVSGIRKGQWKYLTNGGAYCSNQKQIDAQPAMLFNLKEDLAEENNVLDQFPDVAERLKGEIKSLKLKLAEQ